MNTPDPPLPEEAVLYVKERLGPACEKRFQEKEVREKLLAGIAKGDDLADVVLRVAHGLAQEDKEVADEFLGHFLESMMRLGSLSVSKELQRFLDTGDLVNSVAGDVWRDLGSVEFRTRRQFLAWLGQRLRWKASDRARRLRTGGRREDLRRTRDDQYLVRESQTGPSTLAADQELRDRLIVVLVRLPERDREILARHLRGESHRQIAAALGIQEATARKALQRAIANAQALLRKTGS